MKKIIFVCLLSFFAYSQELKYNIEQVIDTKKKVWSLEFIDEKTLIFTQKEGYVGLLDLESKNITYLNNIPKVMNNNQGGMMDVKISPYYKKNKWIYFTYTKNVKGNGATTLSRARLSNNSLVQWQELLVSKSDFNTGYHFGSRITFDNQGFVYFGVGDRGIRENSQNLSNHAGTIMRLHLDGMMPKNNPYVENKNALDEIYSYGHRNPQGLFYDKNRDILFEVEHGPRGGDEINIIQMGKNYGWPVISYGREYWSENKVGIGTHKDGMEQPIKVYTPSIAPSSLIVYKGDLFPSLKGSILVTALKLQHLNIIKLDSNKKVVKEFRVLQELNERLRCVVESNDGEIFIASDSGKIYKMTK